MGKRKAGSLSGKMIVRRGPAEKTGFIIDPTPPPGEAVGGPAIIAEDAAPKPIQQNPEITQSPLPPAAHPQERPTTVTIPRLQTLKSKAQAASDPDAKVVALYPSASTDKPSGLEDEFPAPAIAGTGGDRLVQALRKADIAEAEEVFAEMTGLGHVSVLQLLYGPDGKRLAMACRALGMEQLQFVSVYILSRKLGLGEESLDPRELARVVALFEATDRVEATTLLATWQAEQDSGARFSPEPS